MPGSRVGSDEYFMDLCLTLARHAAGRTSPNPLVGCVIVGADGTILAQTYHEGAGKPHAEQKAIQMVREAYSAGVLRTATLYVNLEPCTHHGKTPPCAPLVIEAGIQRVVVSNVDPAPWVNGRGLEVLRNNGVEVICGVREEGGWWLNRRFFTRMTRQRPYIILKWAETANHFLAPRHGPSGQISSQVAKLLVHRWRTLEDAILVGYRTALLDNPSLTPYLLPSADHTPRRIVLDPKLSLPPHLKLFTDGLPTIVVNSLREGTQGNITYIRGDISTPEGLLHTMEKLASLDINSIIVEGGSKTLRHFIEAGVWDEARIFTSTTRVFSEGVPAPILTRATCMGTTPVGGDLLTVFVHEAIPFKSHWRWEYSICF